MTTLEKIHQQLLSNRDALAIIERGHNEMKDILGDRQGSTEEFRVLVKMHDIYKSARYRMELLINEMENYEKNNK